MPTPRSHRPQATSTTTDALVQRARALVAAADGRRVLLGVVGAPGAGKSTLAARLVEALSPELDGGAALVGMDGFHLAQATLERWGRADRKGAPDTFDAGGYVALLRRLRARDEDVVHAPEFRREIEEPVGSAVPVARETALVVTEGNYLLLDGPWAPVRELLDEVWFLAPDDDLRLARLVARHEAFGRAPEAALAWSHGPDQANAVVVAATAQRADLVVGLSD
ncbi:nucleoside/nucleotide kinase family protein [Streptomyces sp. NP160]|uniref:nucleoside/nucleotide kinase family protein n=1 Tax=Streptomyces sp. NP160 TaxID=2586637 RepID=UPI0011186C77|nr:nucleoside/nucleotide kinase family protein [Streptomyces sp. NP160]TNM68539.1 nucleoside/nucleotide kinase family protein [Streptomyces sp. NP160]